MARTVADTALLANVMSGRHPGDHASFGGPGTLPLDYHDAGNAAGTAGGTLPAAGRLSA